MPESTERDLGGQMEMLTRLVAIGLVEDKETLREKVELLSRVGFQPKWIAELLGTTSNTVRVQLSKQRKAGKTNERSATKTKVEE